MKPLIIGSRGSKLALWQANHVKSELQKQGIDSEIKVIKTKGDVIQHISFDKIEGKGFFTKEIEQALLDKQIDLAIHSHKDLETTQPEGLTIAAVPKRADPSELLLINKNSVDHLQSFSLKKSARVGTSSVRRKSQLLFFRPDLKVEPLRGNVPTRIKKCEEDFDAIILAKAGVDRLGIDLSGFEVQVLDPTIFVPAASQGALAIQIREHDHEVKRAVDALNHDLTNEVVGVERKILQLLGGGCQIPLGIYVEKKEQHYKTWISKQVNEKLLQTYFEHFKLDTLLKHAKTVYAAPSSSQQNRVLYFTKPIKESNPAYQLLKNAGIEVNVKPLLKAQFLDFTVDLSLYTWVFFSSKNGVDSFFSKIKDRAALTPLKIGAIGRDTAAAVKAHGYAVDFFGTQTSTEQSAIEFSQHIKPNQKVLFISCETSNRTVQKRVQRPNYDEIKAYKIEPIEQHIHVDHHQAIAFLSPSGVRSFVQAKNTISTQAQVFCIGEKTRKQAEELLNVIPQNIHRSYCPTIQSLSQAIVGAFS